MTAVEVVEPGGQNHPAAHMPLHALVERPMLAPYVPAGHTVAAELPVAQNDPTGHAETPNVHLHPVLVFDESL